MDGGENRKDIYHASIFLVTVNVMASKNSTKKRTFKYSIFLRRLRVVYTSFLRCSCHSFSGADYSLFWICYDWSLC